MPEEEVSLEFLRRKLAEQSGRSHRPLPPGGGGGTYDGMEERMSALEKTVERLDEKFSDLRVNLAVLSERVSHLPTKEFIYKGIAGLIAVMVALSALAPKLQSIFGIAGH